MSGHSKWATIHRSKESADAKRGMLFSKLARAISIAAKAGNDPSTNFKLRVVIDKAKSVNMPKENIERALRAAQVTKTEETVYEGFGPGGIAVIIQAATDNKNRTAQEIKSLFERSGGRLASPGSVSYGFEQVGQVLVQKTDDSEGQMLALIDAGVEDLEEMEDGIEVYVRPGDTALTRNKIEELGYKVARMELAMRPKNLAIVSDPEVAKRAITFLENLESHDDVQNVYSNIDVPEGML